jgi:hypothetical protein
MYIYMYIYVYIYTYLDPEIEGSGSTPGWLQCSRAVMSDKQVTV